VVAPLSVPMKTPFLVMVEEWKLEGKAPRLHRYHV